MEDLIKKLKKTLADFQQAPATRFVAGALDSLYHRVVKPYGALLGEAAYQGGRYLFDPTFRKAVQGKPLTGEEAEKLNKRPDTLFLKPEQVENRKQIAKTGTAATSKAVLATLGLSNPASALTSAAIAGGLGYGAAKLGGAKDPFYEAGKAAGYSPVYAGINRLTGGPQDILASSLLGKGAGFLQRGLVKGGIYGTGNVLEELIFTPLTEQRSPTGSELAIAGGTGLLSGVGGEALGALKETVKAKIKRLKPDLSDQEAAKQAERYLRLEAGRVVGRQPKLDRKEVKFIGDLREELGLSRYGDEIPQVGLGVRPRSEAEHLDSLKRGAKSALDQELTGMGYSPEQIARLSAKEKRRILKENIPPFAHESFQGGEQASAKATPGQDAALGQIAEAESPQGLKRLFNRLFNPLKNAPASVQEAATAWRKETLTARAEANALAQKFAHIPAEDGWKMARYIQNPTKETAQRLGFDPSRYQTELKELRKVYNQMRREGIKRGLDIGYLENYLNQVWEESWDEIDRKVRSASGKPYFTKQRIIPSYEEGMKLGLTPRFTHPAQLVAHYREALGKALANQQLVGHLVKSGYLVPAQDAPLNWQRIEAPLFPKVTKIVGKQKRIISDYKAPPSIAEAINNIFQPGGGGGSGLEELAALGAKVSKAMQEISLSGGYGPANAFTYSQMIKEVTAGRVRSPLSSFFRSFSEKASNQFFAEHQETIRRMAQEGIPLYHSADYAGMFHNLAKSKTLRQTLGEAWDKLINEPTFKRFLPMLQVNFFDDAYRQALKEGFSPQEAQRIAGEATKNFYGIVDNFSRSQFVEDAVTSAFFAPKFRESMVNFWVNNLKALAPKHWKDPAFKANRKFLVGTVLTYLLYNALNKALTGHAMSENKGGKELSLEIPVGEGRSIFIPLLPSVGTLPRRLGEMAGALKEGDIATATQKAGSFLSQPVSLGSQLLSNRTFYGGPIYQKDDTALEKAGKLAGYALEQSAHPLVGESMAVLQGRKTPFEALLGMAEVPAYPSASTPEKRLPYNYISKQEVDVKTEYVKAMLEGIDENEWLSNLALLRKEGIASGKPILSDSVIDNLYDEGLITTEQRKYLKNLKWDKKNKKITTKGGAGRKIKIKIPKVAAPKAPKINLKLQVPKSKTIRIKGVSLKAKQLTEPKIRIKIK